MFLVRETLEKTHSVRSSCPLKMGSKDILLNTLNSFGLVIYNIIIMYYFIIITPHEAIFHKHSGECAHCADPLFVADLPPKVRGLLACLCDWDEAQLPVEIGLGAYYECVSRDYI